MERVLCAHISEFLEENGSLSSKQFGFRKGRSTEDQLLLTYGQVAEVVDRGEVVDMVYLDFSKAYDLVSHELLLLKLDCIGFSSGMLGWIKSFLSGRKMCVSVGGCSSRMVDATSGLSTIFM